MSFSNASDHHLDRKTLPVKTQQEDDEQAESPKGLEKGKGESFLNLHTDYKLCLCNSDPHKCNVNMLELLYL